ncbi:hypothetical protein RFI_36883 [Reticulomyxa filosa]|uniref:Uncharacterized protein n=1 Tax=Reticulomyxa filosa TaxID=46433 RepID=X6LHF1_RETFI|nr:hypothetical protein RFI_36883 [Reticulomyxa filosa]|eukprot:ETO00557.1 hypothetical protein RFI_36883 [Reticulomyxa filosa]
MLWSVNRSQQIQIRFLHLKKIKKKKLYRQRMKKQTKKWSFKRWPTTTVLYYYSPLSLENAHSTQSLTPSLNEEGKRTKQKNKKNISRTQAIKNINKTKQKRHLEMTFSFFLNKIIGRETKQNKKKKVTCHDKSVAQKILLKIYQAKCHGKQKNANKKGKKKKKKFPMSFYFEFITCKIQKQRNKNFLKNRNQ